jgi:phage-related protein
LAALIQAVIELIPQILEAGVRLIIGLGSGLIKAIPQLIANVPTVILSLFDALVNGVPQMIQAGIQLIMGLEEGETATLPQMLDFIASIPSKIISFLGDMGSLLWNAGSQIIAGFLNGIRAKFEEVKSFVSGIGDWIASHKGPEQYDKTLLIKQGGWIMESLATGLNEGKSEVLDALNGITADISGYTVDANLQPSATSGVFNNTTIVNINGITSSSPSVLEAAGNLVSAVQLDLRMGVA